MFLFCLLLSFLHAEVIKKDFITSLTRDGMDDSFYQKRVKQRSARESFVIFQKLYENNFIGCKVPLKAVEETEEFRIPQIIHQIWLGSSVPERFHQWMQSWAAWNGWEYKLWTDKDIETFPLYNRKLYDQSQNYGEKADILRYEILFQEGGLYVDVDFECLQPEYFEYLHRTLDCYGGIEPLLHIYGSQPNAKSPIIGNALLAAKPGHPLFKKLVEGLEQNVQQTSGLCPILSTGPAYLSKCVMQYLPSNMSEKIVFFPATYFFPSSYHCKHSSKEIIVFPESAAIHYWVGSWIIE